MARLCQGPWVLARTPYSTRMILERFGAMGNDTKLLPRGHDDMGGGPKSQAATGLSALIWISAARGASA